LIEVRQATKTYGTDGHSHQVLQQIDLRINPCEFVAIMGPSGSGKSTLLQLLGGLDTTTEGKVIVNDVDLASLNEKERILFRRRNIGFVFQNYQLLPMLNVEENVAMPLYSDRVSKAETAQRVGQLLGEVGLSDRAKAFPAQLSGGQQQRVAIARALSMKPKLLLADEPTGNLDRKRGQEVLQLLSKLHREEGLTIVMVTHDMYAAGFTDRIVMLRDGRIAQEVADRKGEGGDELMGRYLAELNS